MTTTEIKSTTQKVENLYQKLNELFSANYLELARLAYPKQDGKEDADAVGEMLTLINSLYGLERICNMGRKKLYQAIDYGE